MDTKILLVEDEEKLRRILQLVLSEKGYEIKTAADGREGISLWQKWQPHLVITDLKMKPVNGFEVLRHGHTQAPDTPCIILTAFGTVESAVNAMKNGAYDFLTKPVDHNLLLETVQQALVDTKRNQNDHEIIGTSDAIDTMRGEISLLASTDSAVLIQGESGTGKDLVAKAIHASSPRSSGPFVRINCASIPRDLMESSLFGHLKGAFTGATAHQKGAFEHADGGILFLDEIGDLSLALQPKLLHAVEEKVISPVGSTLTKPVSVKILSATNQDLPTMIQQKLFRMDLYYRLNTMQIDIPPLRNRTCDILMLADYFLHFFCQELKRKQLTISPETLQLLQCYSWPGNIRELRNIMERVALSCDESRIDPCHLPGIITNQVIPEHRTSLDLVAMEQESLLSALQQSNWNQSQAARKLNISRSALRYRLKKYGINR